MTKNERRQREQEVLRLKLGYIVPHHDPLGHILTEDERGQIINYCQTHIDALYVKCPGVAVEDALYQVRPRDAKRPPQDQDAMDLFNTRCWRFHIAMRFSLATAT